MLLLGRRLALSLSIKITSGSTQVIFIDKTTLSVGPNSNILIDEFVYNPNAGSGRMTVTLTKGAMRMVGGNVTHTQGATIKTPLAAIGVRGGVATVKHDARGGTRSYQPFRHTDGDCLPATTELDVGSPTPRMCRGVEITRPGYGVSVKAAEAAQSTPAPVPPAQIAALNFRS